MLTEKIVLSQVTVVPQSSSINVRWDKQILRGDEVISSIPHRKSYSFAQKDEFLSEVENAEAYIPLVGWA